MGGENRLSSILPILNNYDDGTKATLTRHPGILPLEIAFVFNRITLARNSGGKI
jgi:hypothetical protein